MYCFDIVASICNETRRVDSRLICRGLKTEDEAMRYIDEYNISETDYYWLCSEDETAYIEIDVRDVSSGAIIEVITVD